MENNNLCRFIAIAKKYLHSKNIETIVELGARNCEETLDFYNLLHPKEIYTFECNPFTLPICRERVKGIKSIHLIEKAVCNKNGKIRFYPIDQKKTVTTWKDRNPIASSLSKASGKYPIEKYVQKEIKVKAIKLKSFFQENNIHKVDLLWMDIQGAELEALKGLEEKITNIKIMHIEVNFLEIYKKQPLFNQVKNYLDKKGFLLLGFNTINEYFGDAIFLNKKLIKNRLNLLKIKLFGDQELLWNGPRPLLIRVIRFIFKIYKKIFSDIIRYRNTLTWKKKLISFKNQYGIEVNIGLKKHHSSKTKIDVIIPVTYKDMEILPYCVKSVQEYVNHPINKIFIISAKTEDIKTFCDTNTCSFVDENTILPISKKNIKYNVAGINRSGWLFQQLIKLSGDSISILDNYLIVDADTVYIRPRVFEQNNKTIFDISDEYHRPYFKTYKKLLGPDIFLPASFTSHNMMINTSVLRELKNKIEKRSHLKWYEAIINNIDKKEGSFISEQETYGTYMFQNYRNKMILEYWFNLSLKRAKISNAKNLIHLLSPFYKSLSFHNYNNS